MSNCGRGRKINNPETDAATSLSILPTYIIYGYTIINYLECVRIKTWLDRNQREIFDQKKKRKEMKIVDILMCFSCFQEGKEV